MNRPSEAISVTCDGALAQLERQIKILIGGGAEGGGDQCRDEHGGGDRQAQHIGGEPGRVGGGGKDRSVREMHDAGGGKDQAEAGAEQRVMATVDEAVDEKLRKKIHD